MLQFIHIDETGSAVERVLFMRALSETSAFESQGVNIWTYLFDKKFTIFFAHFLDYSFRLQYNFHGKICILAQNTHLCAIDCIRR